jgi:hypothetical protein
MSDCSNPTPSQVKNVQPELPADRSPVRKKSDVQTSNASTNREQILPSGIVSG